MGQNCNMEFDRNFFPKTQRTQKDSGEERVTAKSNPMMNLASRCSERNPDVLDSTTESAGET